MAKSADIGSKKLISLVPDAWVQWVTQNPHITAQEILDAQFQWIARESDVIVKAHNPEHGEFLILNELQLRYNTQVPQRVRNYVALAEEKFKLPTYPVLINILPPAKTVTICDHYEQEFMGIRAYQNYKVINLWDVDANLVLQQPLQPLLPFVPILKNGNTESNVRAALQCLRADQTLNELEPLLAFFASFVLEMPLIQDIMRWDMTVLRESPWYQEILQQGIEQGVQQGIQQGIQQGVQQGVQQERQINLLRILQLKFDEIPSEISMTIQTQDLQRLEELMAIALSATSLLEFQQHL